MTIVLTLLSVVGIIFQTMPLYRVFINYVYNFARAAALVDFRGLRTKIPARPLDISIRHT